MVLQILSILSHYIINLINPANHINLGCLTMVTEEEGIEDDTVADVITDTQVTDAMVDDLTDGVITNGL